jgi:hypothetical protein
VLPPTPAKAAAASLQHPTHMKPVSQALIKTKTPLRIYKPLARKWSFMPRPHEGSLAKDKDAHDWINYGLVI